MNSIIFITFFVTILFTNILAQFQPGSKQIALAHSDIASSGDVFALINNPAGLYQIQNYQFGIYYSPSPFGMKELANGFIAFNQPTRFGNFTVGVKNYGFELYSENEFHLAYSNIFDDKLLLGISTFYQLVNIKNYGNTGFINFSLGGIFLINEDFSIGFSFHNLLRNKDYFSVNTNFRTGLTYNILSNSKIHLSAYKELDFPISVSCGIEYELINYLTILVGIQNNPNIYSGGIEINYSFFRLDYSINTHQELGLSHQFSIITNF